MKHITLILICLIANVTLAQEETTTIYMIRHAEKADGSADPALSDTGKQRTMKWAKYFMDKNIHTYYTTKYKRSIETATFTSSHSMPTDAKVGTTYKRQFKMYDPGAFPLQQAAAENTGKNVVIVGHSNTIPAQINALIGENKYSDIPEGEFGNLYIIRIKGGKITHELVKL